MLQGGYQTISLNGLDLSNAVDDTIDGLYKKITESNKKAVLVGDFKINGIVKNSVFVPVQTQGNAITMNIYGKRITIYDDDLITITDAPTDGILIFDSVDEMNEASAPDGTIALVPSKESGGGVGLTVVVLTTDLSSISGEGGTVNLSADDCAKMVDIFAKGTPYILNCQLGAGMPCNVLMSIGGITGVMEISGGFIMMENLEIKIGITGAGGEYALFINLATPA